MMAFAQRVGFESAEPTTENSPALQCWEQVVKRVLSPCNGRLNYRRTSVVRFADSFEVVFLIPALKCWAIVSRPATRDCILKL
jgi:hypothetical protein